MNKEAQAVFLEYFCKGLQKEANLSVSESIGVAIWFADQNYLLTKIATAGSSPVEDFLLAPWRPDPNAPAPAPTSTPVKTGESNGSFFDGIWNGARDGIAAGAEFLGKGLVAGGASYYGDPLVKKEFDGYIDKGKNFISTIAPYAVPGILSYLGLKASGVGGGAAMAGALGAGAIGGTFWNSQTPEEKQKLLETIGWKSTPAPTKTTQIENNPQKAVVKNELSEGMKDTVDTTVRAARQLNPPSSRYTA